MVFPLAVAGPMAWLQHSPAYLLFGLMSPAMMAGSFLSDAVAAAGPNAGAATGARRSARGDRDVSQAPLG